MLHSLITSFWLQEELGQQRGMFVNSPSLDFFQGNKRVNFLSTKCHGFNEFQVVSNALLYPSHKVYQN